MIRHIAAAMALGCASLAGPALANDEFEQVQGRVSYAGLDLNNPSDIQEFGKRVDLAARQICGRGIADAARYSGIINDCRETVVASGRQQLTLAAMPAGQARSGAGR